MKKTILILALGMLTSSTFLMAATPTAKTFAEKKVVCQTNLKEMTACVDKATNQQEMMVCKKTMKAKMQEMHKGQGMMGMGKMKGMGAGKCAVGKCGGK